MVASPSIGHLNEADGPTTIQSLATTLQEASMEVEGPTHVACTGLSTVLVACSSRPLPTGGPVL